MGQWQSKFSDGTSFLVFWLPNIPTTRKNIQVPHRYFWYDSDTCRQCSVFLGGLQMHFKRLPQMSTIPFLLVGKTRCRVQYYTKSQEASEAVRLITVFKNNCYGFECELFPRCLCLNSWFLIGGTVWGS